MYKVIKAFVHTTDNDYSYSVGDTFPRAGLKVSKELCKELAGTTEYRPYVLLEEVPDPVPPAKATKKKE